MNATSPEGLLLTSGFRRTIDPRKHGSSQASSAAYRVVEVEGVAWILTGYLVHERVEHRLDVAS
jgi:hypothetical protein